MSETIAHCKPGKNAYAVKLGRRGGLKTWSRLTADQRATKIAAMVAARQPDQSSPAPTFTCETCQQLATAHVKAIDAHFCRPCLAKIDSIIERLNAV